MNAHYSIEIDGKRYLWRDLVQLRREQLRMALHASRGQHPDENRKPTHSARPASHPARPSVTLQAGRHFAR